jgi:protein-S-isoprenylcysteine O-methyltransferase Ste14
MVSPQTRNYCLAAASSRQLPEIGFGFEYSLSVLLVVCSAVGYMRHPMYGGLLMASLGLAAVTHDESRLLAAAVLWLVLEQKVC